MYRLRGYNVILGMDWLSYNKAFLDGEKKRIIQALCNSEMRLIFQGSLLDKLSCIMSYAKAKKIMD